MLFDLSYWKKTFCQGINAYWFRSRCNRALWSSVCPFNILKLFVALLRLNAWFTILHGGNSWWLHQKPTGTSKLVDSSVALVDERGGEVGLRLRDDRKGGRRKEKKGERKINDTRISVIAWWFCEGDTRRGQRGGGMTWGTTNCVSISFRAETTVITKDREVVVVMVKKKNEIGCAVDSVVHSIIRIVLGPSRITLRTIIIIIMTHLILIFNVNRKL